MIYPPFIDGSGRAYSGTFQLDRTLNAYVENASLGGAKTSKALIAAPGTARLFDLGDGPVRGQLSLEGYDFIVSAGSVWQKDPLDIITLLGSVANDGLPVKMVANTTQVFLRSAGIGYCIETGAVTAIPSPPWTTLADIEFIDGYFVGLDDDGTPGAVGGQFFISTLNDCTVWDPLDFSDAPASNNRLRALAVIQGLLYVIGSVTTQPFFNSGNADFPLEPNKSATIQRGTTARDSVATLSNDPQSSASTVFMLSEDMEGRAEVVKLVGFSLATISTSQLSRIFQSYSKISDAIGWAFSMGGHSFYQINFPDAQASWRFDASNPNLNTAWSQVSWYNRSTGLQEAHRGVNHGFNLGRHLVGDRQAGIIWNMSQDTYSDGDPTDPSVLVEQFMQREVLLPSDGTRRMFLHCVELLCETGVGDNSGSGSGHDPVVELQVSGDGGRTYGDPVSVRLGKLGEYDTLVKWWGNGSGLQPAIRVTCTAPVKRVWSGLDIRITEGRQ
jgi:hypothetical protein